MARWNNQDVTVLRDAKQGDEGFDANSNPKQILIKLADGSQKVVVSNTVTGA